MQTRVLLDPEGAMDPRVESETSGRMLCLHRHYRIGDEHSYRSAEEIGREEAFVTLPVYAYIHGGITISTEPFSCPWDSGQIGVILMKREVAEREGWDEEQARAVLRAEVEEYDRYLRGENWMFQLLDDEGAVVMSVTGFESEEVALAAGQEEICHGV